MTQIVKSYIPYLRNLNIFSESEIWQLKSMKVFEGCIVEGQSIFFTKCEGVNSCDYVAQFFTKTDFSKKQTQKYNS